MKRKVCLVCVLLMGALIFAAGGKWKATDIGKPKKLEKLIETYKLTQTYTDGTVELYKNPENSDWMYLYRAGSEENLDRNVFLIGFAYLDGMFNSCTFYSGFTAPNENVKYLTACIDEDNIGVPKSDFLGRSDYTWNTPVGLFAYMVNQRVVTFLNMLTIQSAIGLEFTDDLEPVLQKYEYLNNWFREHAKDKDMANNFTKDYKKYLKEHK